jgi:hypothetical protein
MAEKRQDENKDKPKQLTRRGHPIYESNPSLSSSLPVKVKSKKPSKMGESYMISKDGEVLAEGALAFVEEQEVDTEQFVKIYLAGIRQYGELSKAGATMFEYVYDQMSGKEGKDRDTVPINYLLAKRWREELSQRTYERGVSELLEKGFIFRTLMADSYFVNVRYMFNGDRIILAKSYRRKSAKSNQPELPFNLEPPTIEGTAIDIEK